MTYRPGKTARKMYRHKDRYGTAGMSRKQLKALAREMDIGVNPRGHRGHRSKARSLHSKSRSYLDSVTDSYHSHPTMSRRDKHHRKMVGKRYSQRSRRMSPAYRRMRAEEAEYRLRNPRRKHGSAANRYRSQKDRALARHRRAHARGDRRRMSKHGRQALKWGVKAHRARGGRRNPLSCRMSKASMFHELKHHASRWRPQKQRVAIVLSTRRKCGRRNPVLMNPKRPSPKVRAYQLRKGHGRRYRKIERRLMRGKWERVRTTLRLKKRGHWHKVMPPFRRNPVLTNPKRDGSQTKGEKRLQKHAEWLRTIAERGRQATAALKSMRSVPVASHVAAQEHAANKLSEAVIEKAMEGVPAAVEKVADVVEHAEAKFLRQQIADLTMLINSTKEEADSLGEQDEMMAQELMDQVAKMAKQRTALKAKATGLGIQTNPRRRARTVLVGTHRYAKALRELRSAILRRHR